MAPDGHPSAQEDVDPSDRGDSGLSLIELLVTMTIFGGVMLMIFAVLLTVQKDTVRVANRENAITTSRQALAQIDRQVRSGNVLFAPGNEVQGLLNGTIGCESPVALASSDPRWRADGINFGNCMRIYTQSNGANKCVQWQVAVDAARPGTTKLQTRSWTPGAGVAAPWSVVVRGLSDKPTEWPFRLRGALSAYHSRLVDVQLTVQIKDSTRTEDVASSLSGRNTFYGYDPNTCDPVPPVS
jgi:type II secretory pathway pseudopilin PulG